MKFEPLSEPRVPWWESAVFLALLGTLAAHILFVTAADMLVVLKPPPPDPPPAPKLEMFEIEVPPVLNEPPPPPPEPDKAPEPEKPSPAPVQQKVAATTHVPSHSEPPPDHTPPPAETPTTTEGGAPVVAMPDVAPAATGVAVKKGAINRGPVGRGGTGTGTGEGTGSGSGESPAPMSVATIKTRALPKGDYAYEESKDYPAEAKQLAIGGKIRVKLVVDAQGNVTKATLLNKLGHGLDELAMARAQKIVFDPAKDTDDRAVASVVVWTFDMNPPK
ncbi:MAG TPA: TonB family protein [Kofleriaceae bacterium]